MATKLILVKWRNPVDLAFVIRQRLKELGLEQRDLATATQVTESYISQLLGRKKVPPAPDRSDIYEKMGRVLKLPNGELAKLADLERKEEFKRKLGNPPAPLFQEVRELILRKCHPDREKQVRAIFSQQPFGELERLVTEKLLQVVKGVAKKELEDENWLLLVARLGNRSCEQMRVMILEFLDADVFTLSADNCMTFMEPLIESWDVDLATFGMDIILNHSVAPGQRKKFEFVETEPGHSFTEEPGLTEFLGDPSLSGDATEEEIEFLRKLRFGAKRPTSLYYYRELQNLRDPVHFPTAKILKSSSTRSRRELPQERETDAVH
ncbi:MAG: helix-turn-helix transcriptional regulator [Acidobacteria bacterium]|nr:helix-turn-helix transcriptional regulator [Acidobacteriota bacterium]